MFNSDCHVDRTIVSDTWFSLKNVEGNSVSDSPGTEEYSDARVR